MAGLFAFFASAPIIFIEHFGVAPIVFGTIPCFTVFAVFAGGFSAPRLAKRWSGMKPILFGLTIMLIGASAMFTAAYLNYAGMPQVLATLMIFLFGMGIVSPLSTVVAMRPFPEKAGAASALIGFCQMAGGALGTILLSLLPFPLLQALPTVMAGGAIIGLGAVLLFGKRS